MRPPPAGRPVAPPATILLVEQDVAARRTARERLARCGYCVLEAADAFAATVILLSREDVRVIVTDVELGWTSDGPPFAVVVDRCWPWISLVPTTADPPRPFGADVLRTPYSEEALLKVVEAAAAAAQQLSQDGYAASARGGR